MRYMGTGVNGMSWTFWCINPNSGDTGGILLDDWTTINTAKQGYLTAYQFPLDDGGTPVQTNTPTTVVATNTSTRTATAGITSTPSPGASPTRTFTPPVITNTPTTTLTTGPGTCSPVTATITAPFTQDGAGTFCWQSSNLGAYINSWTLTSLIVNGVNETNLYVAAGSLPAKINGYWYVSYNSAVAYGHFEAK